MSQIPLFGDVGADTSPQEKTPQSKPQPRSAAKRIESAVVRKIEIQPEPKPVPNSAKWGYCRVCGHPIAIPGLNASLCSNPTRTCGSNGWVVDPLLFASQSQKGVQANG